MWRTFILAVALMLSSTASADQTRIRNYDTARDDYVYPQVYRSGGSTLYCNKPFSGSSGLQVEHVLPASWMKEAAGCAGRSRKQCRRESDRFNFMEADLHNLWPAIAQANQDRSNYQFAIIGPDTMDAWQGHCDFEVDENARTVEPAPNIRGEIARMVLYMVQEYDIVLPSGQFELMVGWHCKDNDPSPEEYRRNAVIDALQQTRNPFIDDPSLLCEEDQEAADASHGSDGQNDVLEECLIKGNIGKGGTRIYHVPGSQHYSRTKISLSKGERWFCSEAEAQSAGWRPPN